LTFELRDNVYFSETEYGMVLLDGDRGQYWNLNPTGAVVLLTLLEGGTTAQAVQALIERFPVDQASAARDVTRLLTEIYTANLLKK
jgi:Coenzyme PQQ synthesis protein D (PqqD)